jgi:hypothetical protein
VFNQKGWKKRATEENWCKWEDNIKTYLKQDLMVWKVWILLRIEFVLLYYFREGRGNSLGEILSISEEDSDSWILIGQLQQLVNLLKYLWRCPHTHFVSSSNRPRLIAKYRTSMHELYTSMKILSKAIFRNIAELNI